MFGRMPEHPDMMRLQAKARHKDLLHSAALRRLAHDARPKGAKGISWTLIVIVAVVAVVLLVRAF